LKRYPDGVDGSYFYQKKCPSHRPSWVRTARVPKSEGSEINYCVLNDLPTLVWAANLVDLELHTFLHKAPAIARPTALAFDLDRGSPADIGGLLSSRAVAKNTFDSLGMQCFATTSGSKGLQVYVPLNTSLTYKRTNPSSPRTRRVLRTTISRHRGLEDAKEPADRQSSGRLELERRP
jgi:bifunctional non-homologous end joining protein LigD